LDLVVELGLLLSLVLGIVRMSGGFAPVRNDGWAEGFRSVFGNKRYILLSWMPCPQVLGLPPGSAMCPVQPTAGEIPRWLAQKPGNPRP
jgi:hypothetical protein